MGIGITHGFLEIIVAIIIVTAGCKVYREYTGKFFDASWAGVSLSIYF